MTHHDEYAAATTRADARQRAWRTFLQGLAIDVAVAVSGVLGVALGDVHWSAAWWTMLGLLVAKTALQTAVSYLARHVSPPKLE